jgi:succinyl-diaminopimelate desuccinylase
MKAFVAVAMKVLENIANEKLDIKYGVLIVSDEETGGFNGAKHWVENIGIKAKIVFDPDGGKNINTIIQKAKGVLMIKLISKGEEAHGSRPWDGIDAIENLMQTIANLRKYFPHYSKTKEPKDKWISTMHVSIIQGGDATNKIAPYAEAKLDFRLTEKLTQKKTLDIITKCLEDGVKYEFLVDGNNVYTDINNKYLQAYAKCMQNELNEAVIFDVAHSASDGRYFASKGMPIITHQGTGGGLHAKNEWVDINSIYQLEKIQTEFLRNFHKI